MSASEKNADEPGGQPEARLRIDVRKATDARALLAAVDAGVFGAHARRPPGTHAGLIARLVASLFADG
ncbi:MAG TPA: hypothetical protein VII91_07105 [Bauldia sp.]